MSDSGKKIAIIGATSLIAEHCARLWIKEDGIALILVGRDRQKTERVASDLQVRNPAAVIRVHTTDFLNPQAVDRLVDTIALDGPLDIVMIAHGTLPDQLACQNDLDALDHALKVNGISPVLFAEAVMGQMTKHNHGILVILGSVAGDRGRKSNYAYGSAKGLVSRYAQGLQHRTAGTGVRVVLVKPGPTETPMTAHLKDQGARLANVDEVARIIVSSVEKKSPVVYVPGKWRMIMAVIRHLPDVIFNKLNI